MTTKGGLPMTHSEGQLSTTRTAQIWVGAACMIVFMFLIFGHLATLRDRTLVTSAIQDADRFRHALTAFEIDYGQFPQETIENPYELVKNLKDPDGLPYMHLPSDREVTGFSYTPDSDGDGYTIIIRARDRNSTPVVASPVSTTISVES